MRECVVFIVSLGFSVLPSGNSICLVASFGSRGWMEKAMRAPAACARKWCYRHTGSFLDTFQSTPLLASVCWWQKSVRSAVRNCAEKELWSYLCLQV